jgi:hypothetical protein
MAKSIASLLSESDCGCKVVDEARSKELGDGKWEYEGKVGVWRTLSNGDRAFFPDDGGAPLAAARTLKHPSNGGKPKVVDRRTIREGLNEAKLAPGQGPDLNVMLNFDLEDGKAYNAKLIVVSDAKKNLYGEVTLFPKDKASESWPNVEKAIRDAYKKLGKKIDLGSGVVSKVTQLIYDAVATFEASERGADEHVVAHLIAGEDGKVKILTGLKRVAVGNQYQYRDPSEPEKRGTPASQMQEGSDEVSSGTIPIDAPFMKAMQDMAMTLAEKHLKSKLGYGAKDEMDVTISSVDPRPDGYVIYMDEQIKGLSLSVYLKIGKYEVRTH